MRPSSLSQCLKLHGAIIVIVIYSTLHSTSPPRSCEPHATTSDLTFRMMEQEKPAETAAKEDEDAATPEGEEKAAEPESESEVADKDDKTAGGEEESKDGGGKEE